MSPSPNDAVARLAAALKADPPAAVADLQPAVVSRLSDAVMSESRRQEEAIADAIDHALRLVPRPLRGIVKKLIRS